MQEHSNRLMAGVQKSVMSFRGTLCMLCIAAVLGKVIVTVFVSSCLYVHQRMPSVAVFQQFPPNRKIRKSSGKKGLQGAGRNISILWERREAQIQSMLSVPPPRAFQLDHSALISRTGKPVNCNCFTSSLFSLPCNPEHTVISK